jgi:hypothetical protein
MPTKRKIKRTGIPKRLNSVGFAEISIPRFNHGIDNDKNHQPKEFRQKGTYMQGVAHTNRVRQE